MNNKLEPDIIKYPFINSGKPILKDIGLTMELIDDTTIYDEILKECSKDIVDSIIRKRENWDISTNETYEVMRFYTTMIILKTLPFLITKYYITDYLRRFDKYYTNDINSILSVVNNEKLIIFFNNFLIEFAPNLKLKEITDPTFPHGKLYGMHMTDYLDIGILANLNDPIQYKQLLLINRNTHQGFVSFYIQDDYPIFRYIFHKLIEQRILEYIKKLDKNFINSTKIEACTNQIKKYLVSNSNLKEKIQQQESIQLHITNNTIPIDTANPPCIIKLLDKIKEKKILTHSENILLGTYLVKRDFTKEQLIEVFNKASNYDSKVTGYNIDYLLKRQLMPQSCTNLDIESLCFKNNSCIKLQVKNPLSYKEVN